AGRHPRLVVGIPPLRRAGLHWRGISSGCGRGRHLGPRQPVRPTGKVVGQLPPRTTPPALVGRDALHPGPVTATLTTVDIGRQRVAEPDVQVYRTRPAPESAEGRTPGPVDPRAPRRVRAGIRPRPGRRQVGPPSAWPRRRGPAAPASGCPRCRAARPAGRPPARGAAPPRGAPPAPPGAGGRLRPRGW